MNSYQLLTYSTEVGVAGLYQASVQGVWYDPSNLSTLFQDSAFTVPVTAVEQPVGGMLDLSGRGNHALQTTTTKRPVYSRRVNLIAGSEQWNRLPGTDGTATVSQENTILPPFLAAVSVSRVTAAPGWSLGYQYQTSIPVVQGSINMCSFFFKPIANCVRVSGATSASDPFYFDYNLLTKATTLGVNTGALRVEEFPDGWLRFCVTQKNPAVDATRIFVIVGISGSSNAAVFLTTGYDSRAVTDAHLPYQRVTTATDYDADPAKFPAYLRFDGVDDALQTGNIDFTSTDKMTVLAGILVSSSSDQSGIFELGANSTTSNGLSMQCMGSTFTTLRGQAFGTSRGVVDASGFASNTAYRVCAQYDLSAALVKDEIRLRNNGVYVGGPVLESSGTGNFSSYPLTLMARGYMGTFTGGRLYSLIVRGAQSSLAQIEATELYIKQKMRMP